MNREEAILKMDAVMKELACMPKQKQPPAPVKGEEACLVVLSMHDGKALPGTLAKESGVSCARMAATLRQLESKNYVRRDVNPEDRRQVLVSLTEEGWECAKQAREEMNQKMGEIYDLLGDEDTEALIRILRKFAAHAASMQGMEAGEAQDI